MADPLPKQPDALPVDFGNIPDDLRDRDQWVCWRYVWRSKREEWTKVPVDVATGGNASPTDPDTWSSFEQVREFHESDDTESDGVGFVVSNDDLLVGVDLDDCRDPESGKVEPWARELVEDTETYAEVSPSGTGIHAYGFALLPDGGNRGDVEDTDGHIEMYDNGRYLTVTGAHLDLSPSDVQQVNETVGEIHAEYVANGDTDGEEPDSPGTNPRKNGVETGSLSDDEVIEKAKDAENGDKFAPLWGGDTSGYPSHSEARCALANQLAFWTQGDVSQMRRLFKRSDLAQQKPEKSMRDFDDYLADKARQNTDYYDPSNGHKAEPPTLDEPAGGDHDGLSVELCPTEVIVRAGLGEDGDVSGLNDRKKAAIVWDLIKASDEFHVRVMRNNDSLWSYDGGVWNPQGKRALRHAARKALGSMNYGQNVLSELEAQARSDPTVEIEADDLGLEPGLLAVENGIVDLEAAALGHDGALRELTPEDLAMAQLPVEYDPNATYDEWSNYVDEWAESGKADVVQEYVGYCLHTGGFPHHRALLLVGSGANGKSVFLSVVREMLGRENTTSIELQTLANEDNAVADFYGAVANIDDDLSARKLGQGLGMFKKLTGDNRVRARRLYEEGFEFDATGKHLYAANEVPDVDVDDDDEAFWRRWLLVEFPNYYPPNNRNPDLCADLTEPGVLSGVLNWAIEGWHRLVEQSKFTGDALYAHEKRQRWQQWGDSVDKFIAECVEHDPDAENVTTSRAYNRYVAWCQENHEECVGQQKFTNQMKVENVGYGTSVRPGGTGNPTNGYKALGFTDDVPHADERRTDNQSRL